MRGLIVLAGALLAMTAPGIARADCDADIKKLQSSATSIANARIRQLVDYDIKRANKESSEGDEDECKEAIDHATKLLTTH